MNKFLMLPIVLLGFLSMNYAVCEKNNWIPCTIEGTFPAVSGTLKNGVCTTRCDAVTEGKSCYSEAFDGPGVCHLGVCKDDEIPCSFSIPSIKARQLVSGTLKNGVCTTRCDAATEGKSCYSEELYDGPGVCHLHVCSKIQ